MGRRGQPKKPTALKLLQGIPGGRHKLNTNEPKPRKASPSELKCPADLPDDAKAHWKKYAPKLHKLSLFTELDVVSFRMYCELYADYLAKRQMIREKGEYVPVYHGQTHTEAAKGEKPRLKTVILAPWAKQIPEIRQELLRLEKEFGMTPASRAGINVSPALAEADEAEQRLFGAK